MLRIFRTRFLCKGGRARPSTRSWAGLVSEVRWSLSSESQSVSQFSRSVVSDSLWLHGLQYARLPCPLPTAGAYSNSCPLTWWCHSTISFSVIPFSFHLQFSQHQGLFQWVSSSIRSPKYWSFSFSISLSNECLGMISFRIDWFDLLAVQGTLKSLLQHHSSEASVRCSAFFMVQLSYSYMTTGKLWLDRSLLTK